jgi:hypothetical protein
MKHEQKLELELEYDVIRESTNKGHHTFDVVQLGLL